MAGELKPRGRITGNDVPVFEDADRAISWFPWDRNLDDQIGTVCAIHGDGRYNLLFSGHLNVYTRDARWLRPFEHPYIDEWLDS